MRSETEVLVETVAGDDVNVKADNYAAAKKAAHETRRRAALEDLTRELNGAIAALARASIFAREADANQLASRVEDLRRHVASYNEILTRFPHGEEK